MCFNTHSGHLFHEQATFNGVHTSTLTVEDSYSKASQMQELVENLILENRQDLRLLNNCYLQVDNQMSPSYWDALQSTTHIGLEEAVNAKMKLDEIVKCNGSLRTMPPLFLKCHPLPSTDKNGARPPNDQIGGIGLAPLLESMAFFITQFLENLLDSVLNPRLATGHLAQIVVASSAKCDKKSLRGLVTKYNEVHSSGNIKTKNLFIDLMASFNNFLHIDDDTVSVDVISSNVDYLYISTSQLKKQIATSLSTNKTYELRVVVKSFSNDPSCFWIRHGNPYDSWWKFEKGVYHKEYLIPQFDQIDGLLYVALNKNNVRLLSKKYLAHISGQTKYKCREHQCFLVKNHNLINRKCSHHDTCTKKSFWICPLAGCSASVCLDNKNDHPHVTDQTIAEELVAPAVVSNGDDSSAERDSLCSTDQEIDDVCYDDFVIDSGFGDLDNDIVDMTDAGVFPDIFKEKTTSTHVPMKVLLNNELNILRRKTTPLFCINHHKHFLQSLVSKTPSTSIPIIYPEAMIFPSIFWKQWEDCSYAGALPSCLLSDDNVNKKLGFATLKQHLQCRIMNGSSLTSANQHYASFAFDCLMNDAMNKEHSASILFRRGWETQLQQNDSIPLNGCFLRLDENEVRLRVKELAAALSEEPATYFLTLTCNMASHFGIFPLFHALQEFYSDSPEYIFKAAIQSSIGLFTRMWDRVIKYLMDYIENSPEEPCGPFKRIWWRVVFQTTKGNLPHIHCLIWTDESKDNPELQHRIVCSESNLLWKLRDEGKLQQLGLIEDDDEAMVVFNDAIRVHYHSCAANGYRCHKKTDDSTESKCRRPRYQSGYQYFLEEIYVQHDEEAFKILEEVGLAYKDPLRPGNYNVTEELRAGRWHYPNQKHESLSPISAHIFAFTRSQMNLLICDKYFQSRYLAKYAAGADDKGRVKATVSSTAGVTNISVQDPQNEKISGVKRRLRDDTFLGRFVSITECYWHLLDLNSVYSSFNVINVQTTQIKNRVCVIDSECERRLF